MKGMRGVFAAMLVLESIVVLLALLVLARFGNGPPAVGVAVIVGLAVLMIVGSGLQRRPWGLGVALVLQVVTIVAGFVLVTAARRGRGGLRAGLGRAVADAPRRRAEDGPRRAAQPDAAG